MKSKMFNLMAVFVTLAALIGGVFPAGMPGVSAAMVTLAMPDYYGTIPNYANSPLPFNSAPTVGFSGGGGTGAAATAIVSSGAVSAITITNGGGAYYTAPAIVISGGGGTGATATAVVNAGVIAAIAVTAGGAGYTSAPTVIIASGAGATATATVTGGAVTAITPTVGGAGYNLPPSVTIVGAGTGATAMAQVSAGAVTGFIITNGGAGYTAAPTVVVAAPGTGGAATAAITGGAVTGFTITSGGTGYTSAPTVSITGGGGTGAAATATVSGGAVTALTLTNGGTGYGALTGSGMRKFVDGLPGLGPTNINNLGQYLSVAVADTITYPGTDYYVIAAQQYTKQMHSDLPATTLRGYVQLNNGTNPATNLNTVAPAPIQYMGPVIVAQRNRPVRILFVNQLPLQASGGDLFLPTDVTYMGAGMGPLGGSEVYTDNRSVIHLHGGTTPWISDGTPHQWVTPAGETTSYPRGVSTVDVPDMAVPPNGSTTLYWTNEQSARLMFYHDHAYGITRLNVYDGITAGYLVEDPVEQTLISGGTIGTTVVAAGTIPATQIPLIIQDKTFVPPPAQLAAEDPTWNTTMYGGYGSLWFPHVYMPNQNPWDIAGVNANGRWDYGPWFWPPFTGLQNGPVANPLYPSVPGEPPMNPGTPNPSGTPEAFMDTPVVNGTAYPVLKVSPTAYRFRILNGCNDRSLNLQLYYAKSNNTMWNPDGTLNDPDAGEVNMVPAIPNAGLPASWPTDGRAGGVPDPNAVGPSWIQIGSEGGFLPAVSVIPPTPVGYDYNRRSITVLNVLNHCLLIGPAERADVIVDFSQCPPGTNLILYNDSPAPIPGFDPRIDYFTGDGDQTSTGGAPNTLPGYGPNTRTIMQIQVTGTPTAAFNLAALQTALPVAYAASQPPPIVPQAAYNAAFGATYPADAYVRIQDNYISFFNGPLSAVVMSNGGSGYTSPPTVSITGGGGTGAVGTAVLANGAVRAITVTNPGSGYMSPPTITFTGGGGTGAAATARIASGVISGVVINNGGSGYTSAPTIAFSGGSGTGAAATATIGNGVVTAVNLTNAGTGYTSSPVVTISGGGGTGAAASATGVYMELGPKTIQELFSVDYGRMNATLGTELPFTTMTIQTTIPLGYIDPPTELIQDSTGAAYIGATGDGTQIWKITHNGVDTHFVHVHLFNVQLINRVGWDGMVKPPDENELGWKETIRMNPLEDIIIALRPTAPTLPFNLPDSIRPYDTTRPIGSTMGFTNIDPTTGNPITVTNQLFNYGWEYVWHCHILGHEENDMMRAIGFYVNSTLPPAPILTATSGTGNNTLTWIDGTPFNYSTWLPTSTLGNPANEIGFLVQRATVTGGTPGPYTQIASVSANATTYADTTALSGVVYSYIVVAYNAAGSANSNAATASAATSGLLLGIATNQAMPGAGVDTANCLLMDRYIALASGDITSIQIKAGASGNVKVAIYADSGGQPGALLVAMNTSTPVVNGWNTIPIATTPVVQGTAYWLAMNSDAPCILFVATGGTSRYLPNTLFAGYSFSNPAPAGLINWTGYHAVAGWGAIVSATAPTVTNNTGASGVTATSARLNGTLSGGAAMVTVYWGATDGGTTPASWANTVSLGALATGSFFANISGLTSGATYYYRCFAQNSGGTSWATSSATFTAVASQLLIGVGLTQAMPGSGVDTANCLLLDRYLAQATGSVTAIWVKAGASGNVKVAIYADNAGQPGALLNATNTATPVADGWNSIPIAATAVTQNTAYWLAMNSDVACILFVASGGFGEWQTGQAFGTYAFPVTAPAGIPSWTGFHAVAGWGTVASATAPSVTNGTGASNVIAMAATLNGVLSGGTAAVTVYWGTADGGTVAGSWTNSVSLGTTALGAFSTNLTGLTAGATYYYRCFAQNPGGSAWAAASATFSTSSVLIGVDTSQRMPGAGLDTANCLLLDKYVALATGNVTSIAVKAGASGNVKVAIYADSGGQPGALLNTVNTATPVIGGWNSIPITSTAVTQGTAYWLAMNSDTPCILFVASGGFGEWQTGQTFGTYTFPATAPAGLPSWTGYHAIEGRGTSTSSTAPTITNGTGATYVPTSSARLNGVLSGGAAAVTFYWGPADGGTVAANWLSSITLPSVAVGSCYVDLTGVAVGNYFYRCYVQNPGGSAWAAASATFSVSQLMLGIPFSQPMPGSGVDSANCILVDKYSAQATGNVIAIWIKGGASGNVKVGIYSDNAGNPGTLLNAVNTATPIVDGWNRITITSTAVASGTSYWIAMISDSPCILFSPTGGTSRYLAGQTFGTFNFITNLPGGLNSWAGYHAIAGWGF